MKLDIGMWRRWKSLGAYRVQYDSNGYRRAGTLRPKIYPLGHRHHRFHSSKTLTSIYIKMSREAHVKIFHNMIQCRTVLPSDVTSAHVLSNRNTGFSITGADEMRRYASLYSVTIEKRRYAARCSWIWSVGEEETEYVRRPDIKGPQSRFHIRYRIHFTVALEWKITHIQRAHVIISPRDTSHRRNTYRLSNGQLEETFLTIKGNSHKNLNVRIALENTVPLCPIYGAYHPHIDTNTSPLMCLVLFPCWTLRRRHNNVYLAKQTSAGTPRRVHCQIRCMSKPWCWWTSIGRLRPVILRAVRPHTIDAWRVVTVDLEKSAP
jgi:hypothetical protein